MSSLSKKISETSCINPFKFRDRYHNLSAFRPQIMHVVLHQETTKNIKLHFFPSKAKAKNAKAKE